MNQVHDVIDLRSVIRRDPESYTIVAYHNGNVVEPGTWFKHICNRAKTGRFEYFLIYCFFFKLICKAIKN